MTRTNFSSTPNCDFQPLTTIGYDLSMISDVFTGKIIVEEIESIMSVRTEQSSPSWVCIPQKSLPTARDFWNTNSGGWTLFHIRDSKVHGANMGPIWVLSAPDGPHVDPLNLAIRDGCPWWILYILYGQYHGCWYPGEVRSHVINSQGVDPVHYREDSNHWQIHCLFKHLCRLTSKKKNQISLSKYWTQFNYVYKC